MVSMDRFSKVVQDNILGKYVNMTDVKMHSGFKDFEEEELRQIIEMLFSHIETLPKNQTKCWKL